MVAAGIWSFLIDSTASAFGIEIQTVTVCHSRKSEGCGLGMKMFNDPFFAETFKNIFHVLFEFKGINCIHSYKIFRLHLNGKTATGTSAMITHFLLIFRPCGQVIHMRCNGRNFKHKKYLTQPVKRDNYLHEIIFYCQNEENNFYDCKYAILFFVGK